MMKNLVYILCVIFSHANTQFFSQTNNYNSKLDNLELNTIKHTLDSIYDEDQKYREVSQQELNLSDIKKMESTDKANYLIVSHIIDKYGWLSKSEIGEKANSALFLVIQHTELDNQKKYFEIMKVAVKNGNARMCDLALLEDRILMFSNKKQKYGSQIVYDQTSGESKIYPIEDEFNVNKLRKEAGLEPIEEYAKKFGIKYKIKNSENKLKKDLGTYLFAIAIIITLIILLIKFRKNKDILSWMCFYTLLFIFVLMNCISDISDPMLPSNYNSFKWLLSITINLFLFGLLTTIVKWITLKITNKFGILFDVSSISIGFTIVTVFVLKIIDTLFFKGNTRIFGFNLIILIFLIILYLIIKFIVNSMLRQQTKSDEKIYNKI